MNSVVLTLDKALKHSKDILKLAEAEDWERVEAELNERDQQLRAVLNLPTPAHEAEQVRTLAAEIQATSAKIAALVESARNNVSSQIKKQQKGKKMQAAYSTTKRSY